MYLFILKMFDLLRGLYDIEDNTQTSNLRIDELLNIHSTNICPKTKKIHHNKGIYICYAILCLHNCLVEYKYLVSLRYKWQNVYLITTEKHVLPILLYIYIYISKPYY